MSNHSVFALFRPGLMATSGYAYRRADLPATGHPMAVVDDPTLKACACVGRAPSSTVHSAPSWNWWAVAGYNWDTTAHSGVLHVSLGEEIESIPFKVHEIEALEYAPYASRPCINRPIVDLMPAEMQAIHAIGYFTGTGCRATRRSKSILEKLQWPRLAQLCSTIGQNEGSVVSRSSTSSTTHTTNREAAEFRMGSPSAIPFSSTQP
ncbi:hypothetical protein ON010_g1782 [Phytophthora cinnamomi]|nr:hypothetical protein ON010_g1782 [Phytophthora cinnamomi]